MKEEYKSPKTKVLLLSITIAIVLSAFVIYFVQSVYPKPKYEDFCPTYDKLSFLGENITQSICESQNGTWTSQPIQCFTTPCPQSYCDFYAKCQEEYDQANDKYNFVVFIVAIISGILSITLGIILALTSVSFGLMLGGTFLIFYGTAIYWSDLSNWIRTIMLGIALVILIGLGYKKLKN
jgi:hypothetical protein